MPDWLTVVRNDGPLLVSIPHAGTAIPSDIEARLLSFWLARKDADWWLERLYGFAADLGATVIRTAVSRTVIDVNRDPSGASLYPGQATTGLCPTETFDGEPLYLEGCEPSDAEIARRRRDYFDPYHATVAAELARLSARHPRVVLYDCHSIRSRVPRLFTGQLPQFNVGTNDGRSCGEGLTAAVERACDASGLSRVTNGRFKGGYITRHYGRPDAGVHAIQMELACRGYMREPSDVGGANWPPPYSEEGAARLGAVLRDVLAEALVWAREQPAPVPAAGVS
ncbi:MAG: N-formylglutamate deformylase [Vicinamibacterales bacterium]